MAMTRSAVAVLLAVLAALSASPAAASWNPCKPICYPWRQWHPRNCPWKHCKHAHNCWYKNKWTKKWKKGYRCVRRTPPKPTPPPKPTGPLCKPKCYPWPTWHPKDCPWKHCAHEQKCYYKNKYGKWVKGHRCVPRAPPTPTPTPAGPTCRPKCYPWPTWNAKDCPWKHCAHDRKCYYKNKAGKWVKGHRCVPRTAATPTPAPASASPSVSPSPSPKVEGPPKICPNKCYRKWRDARDTCNMAICRVRGCSFWKGGRKIWGFRCINKPVVKPSASPSPSAAPSPEAVYPNFCPLKCRRWKSAVAVLCNPAKCRVAACNNPRQPWGKGYNCVPLKPSAAPSPAASAAASAAPSASASPSAKPVVVGPCEQRCRRNRWRVVRECDMAYCEVKGCVASGKKWKYGYECAAKVVKPTMSASPSASPTPSVSPKVSVCGNKCLWSKKRWEVEDLCDPLKCRIVRCLPWKALKCVDKY